MVSMAAMKLPSSGVRSSTKVPNTTIRSFTSASTAIMPPVRPPMFLKRRAMYSRISTSANTTATRLFCRNLVPMAALTLLSDSCSKLLSGQLSFRLSSSLATCSVVTVSVPGIEIFRVWPPVATFSPVCRVRPLFSNAEDATFCTSDMVKLPS